jgi:hypothetical protein
MPATPTLPSLQDQCDILANLLRAELLSEYPRDVVLHLLFTDFVGVIERDGSVLREGQRRFFGQVIADVDASAVNGDKGLFRTLQGMFPPASVA